jgi:NAD(P)-dependent dehydrogenase (short-subunit alcohol dehydrogenase family)
MTNDTDPRSGSVGRMAGRRAVVSGGANGLGAATVELFAREGAAVAIVDLESMRNRAEQLTARIQNDGGSAIFVPIDVRDAASVKRSVDEAVAALGGVDAVVASAGVGAHPQNKERHSDLLNIDPEHFDFVLDVNLRGVFLTIQATAQHMVASGTPGSIVALASMASKRPTAGAYSVSKAAVWMLTRCFAQELGPRGIRVNAIGPGYVETELFDSIVRQGSGPDPDAQQQFRDTRKQQIVLGEFPLAEDIAQTALFLCSDAGRMFTGSILHPDGGYTSTFGGG